MIRKSVWLIIVLGIGLITACSSSTANDEKMGIVEKFIALRNDKKWEEAAQYVADDLVWRTPTGRLDGREAWLSTSIEEDGGGIFEDVQNMRLDGDTVIVEMIVTGPDFISPAVAEVLVVDGKIQEFIVQAP
jgi:hypothetical protein